MRLDAHTPPLRPKLGLWLFERSIPFEAFGADIGVGREQVRRYCLPWSSPQRATPRPEVMAKIAARTGGDVTANDFVPPAEPTPHIRAAEDVQ